MTGFVGRETGSGERAHRIGVPEEVLGAASKVLIDLFLDFLHLVVQFFYLVFDHYVRY